MPKRLIRGDVVRIAAGDNAAYSKFLGDRLVYLQYLGKHPEYGYAVAVCPAPQSALAEVSKHLFKDAYVAFYPPGTAVNRGLATVVGRLQCLIEVPHRLRRAGALANRKVETWVIEDPPNDEVVTRQLSAAELALPIASIWNHECLLERVSRGWRPTSEW
jgi:hypothetical protein